MSCWQRNEAAARIFFALFLVALATGIPLHAKPSVAETDTTAVRQMDLEQAVHVETTTHRLLSLREGVSGVIDMGEIRGVPSFMGNADPMGVLRLLPIFQVNAESDGGLYMQGADHSHTRVSQHGVPIYGVSHLLGLFSVFNSPHYKGMRYATSSGDEMCLAGAIDMSLRDTVPRTLHGEFSMGLLSSQLTLDFPLHRRSSLAVSARRTYVNLLYKRMLRYGSSQIKYGFTDANLTWLWNPSRRNKIWLDVFAAMDDANYGGGVIQEMDAKWYSGTAALHWRHHFPHAEWNHSLFISNFGLTPYVDIFATHVAMPSYIRHHGYKTSLRFDKGLRIAGQISYYDILPQNLYSEGRYNLFGYGTTPSQRSMEGNLSVSYEWTPTYWMTITPMAAVCVYREFDGELPHQIGPIGSLEWEGNFGIAGKLVLRAEEKRQHLFQAGLTNMGLPCEFYFAAGDFLAPQLSHGASASYNVELFKKMFALSVEGYYRILENQVEYTGTLTDTFSGQYSLESVLSSGNGRAYGGSIMLQKQRGKLTGWVAYAYSRSLRTMSEGGELVEVPSSHERLHELDVVATLKLGRWDIGGSFVAASGTPYIPPASFYMLGNRLVTQYGQYNSARLPDYMRLDLSVTWNFRRVGIRTNGVTLSLYNVLCRENAVGYGITVDTKEKTYQFRPMSTGIKLLPSLAYFHKF